MKYVIVSLLLLVPMFVKAQTDLSEDNKSSYRRFKNKIAVSSSFFYLLETHSIEPQTSVSRNSLTQLFTLQYGVDYQRNVFKNFSVQIAYMQWDRNITFAGEGYVLHPRDTGYVHFMYGYKMMDFSMQYHYYPNNTPFHDINLAVGLSYTWGTDSYLLFNYVNPMPPYDVQRGYDHRKSTSIGLISQLGYDYSIIRNRLFVGGVSRIRYYFNHPSRFDIQFHLGIKF